MIKPITIIFVLSMSLIYPSYAGTSFNIDFDSKIVKYKQLLNYTSEHKKVQQIIGIKPYNKVLGTKQLKCLTENVYFEARNENKVGKVAVALVTLNRLKNKRYPNTICGVVYQKARRACQFSWTCNGNKIIKYLSLYRESEKVAKNVLLNYKYMNDVTRGATNFHRKDVRPRWAMSKYKTTTIGKHIFYKL